MISTTVSRASLRRASCTARSSAKFLPWETSTYARIFRNRCTAFLQINDRKQDRLSLLSYAKIAETKMCNRSRSPGCIEVCRRLRVGGSALDSSEQQAVEQASWTLDATIASSAAESMSDGTPSAGPMPSTFIVFREPNALASGISQLGLHSEAPEASTNGSN